MREDKAMRKLEEVLQMTEYCAEAKWTYVEQAKYNPTDFLFLLPVLVIMMLVALLEFDAISTYGGWLSPAASAFSGFCQAVVS